MDSVEEAKNEIIRQIKVVERDTSEVDTPISVALDLQILRQSENPERRSIADLISTITELRTDLIKIEQTINSPESLFPPEYMNYIMKKQSKRADFPDEIIFEIENEIENLIRSGSLSKENQEYFRLEKLLDNFRYYRNKAAHKSLDKY